MIMIDWTSQKTVNRKHVNTKKEKQICCLHKLNWENVLVNSIGKGPFTSHAEALVNILLFQLTLGTQRESRTGENHQQQRD